MVVTPKGIMLTRREFESLPEYSCSLPTGTTEGKRWKRSDVYRAERGHRRLDVWELNWWMGEYVPSKEPGMIGIEWTPMLLPPSLQSANAANPQPPNETPEERQNDESSPL